MKARLRVGSAKTPALAADDRASVAVRAVVRLQLRAFARQEVAARAGEVEAVHQLRVATRRLRATLRLFAPVLPAMFVTWTRQELEWLGGVIGAVRDVDVLIQAVGKRAARVEPSLRRALGPLGVATLDERARVHETLIEVLDSARARRLLDRLARFAESEPAVRSDERLGDLAAGLQTPLVRSVRRAGRRALAASEPEALHRLRVRAKRLRYAVETLRGLGGRREQELVRRLTQLQDHLGEYQDITTQVHWLRDFAVRAGVAPATVLGVGALIHELSRRGRKLHARFAKRWRKLEDKHLAPFADTLDRARRPARQRPRLRAAAAS